MILIYSEEITPRLNYIANLLFTQILKVEIRVTTDSSEFLTSDFPKLNYSSTKFNNEFYIKPYPLLFSKNLNSPEIKPVWYNKEKYFFESSEDSVFPFDPLAASFFLVTRFEEYVETERDKYNRYAADKSILSDYNLLKKPAVNIWTNLLAEKLKEKFPQLVFPELKFEFLSTIDIDNAWAYLHKGFWRSSGAIIKAVGKGNFAAAAGRIKVIFGLEKDEYDTYDFIDSVFQGNEEKVRFFFLLGDYSRYDKNISPKNRHLRKLIQGIGKKYKTGIHPSFLSGKKQGSKRVKKEIHRLEMITGKKAEISRQHFLSLNFPKTYRRLIKAGISEDYTMGYASQSGFRAGICTPFYFYDLKNEQQTDLKIIPFQVMDVTLRDYMGLQPESAWLEIEQLMQEVKDVSGTFVSIWHNETINDSGGWKGFREIFIKMNKTGFGWANE